jgi:hypothetical protein
VADTKPPVKTLPLVIFAVAVNVLADITLAPEILPREPLVVKLPKVAFPVTDKLPPVLILPPALSVPVMLAVPSLTVPVVLNPGATATLLNTQAFCVEL